MKNYIRKADIILLIALIVVGIAASAALSMSRTAAGSDAKVVIESAGETYARYSLYEDTDIVVPAPGEKTASPDKYNEVVIKGGEVYVSEASCKNQVCVRHGHISKAGETIVCLPNRLVVRIESGSGEGGGYDTVTS